MPGREILQVSDETMGGNDDYEESPCARLARETWAFGSGTVNGIKAALVDTVDHPEESIRRAALAGGIGLILGAVQARSGIVRLGVEAFAVATAMSAERHLQDSLSSGSSSGSPEQESNRKGEVFGRFLADTALMGFAGLGGAKLGQTLAPRGQFSFRDLDGPSLSSYDKMQMDRIYYPRNRN